MRSKPNYCYESGCPLAVTCSCSHLLSEHPEEGHCGHLDGEKLCECPGFQSRGLGFVLGVGDPERSRLGLVLEAPGKDEISFPIEGVGAPGLIPSEELERREKAYPELKGTRFVKVGAPIVGKSGSLVNSWILPKLGVRREEIFVDNTLRCLPPQNKQGVFYPVGEERAKAELCCRKWDRVEGFKPDLVEITLHPAGILREVTPLPLLIKDAEKWVSATKAGFRSLLLMGGKAAETFLGYGDNVTRWRGHYELTTLGWYERVVERLKRRVEKGKTKKVGKVARIAEETSDPLSSPSLEPFRPKRKRRVRCKVCKGLGEHVEGCSMKEEK